MKNIKFWLVQIAMVALVSLIFGSPVLAGKNKAASSDDMSHGEMTRLDNANMDNGKASWKTDDTGDDNTGSDDNTGGDDNTDDDEPCVVVNFGDTCP